MVRIRRFNVVKTSTVVALMYMVVVAIFAIPFFLFFAIAGVSTNGGPTQGPGAAGAVAGLAVAVVAVLFYGLLGWVFTAIACLIYNLVAGWVGGIEVEVDRPEPPAPPPAWMTSGTTPQAPPAAGPPSTPVP
jgi:hypothetical protein